MLLCNQLDAAAVGALTGAADVSRSFESVGEFGRRPGADAEPVRD